MFFPPFKPESALLQIFYYPQLLPSQCYLPVEFPSLLIQGSQLCKSVNAKHFLFILALSGI